MGPDPEWCTDPYSLSGALYDIRRSRDSCPVRGYEEVQGGGVSDQDPIPYDLQPNQYVNGLISKPSSNVTGRLTNSVNP